MHSKTLVSMLTASILSVGCTHLTIEADGAQDSRDNSPLPVSEPGGDAGASGSATSNADQKSTSPTDPGNVARDEEVKVVVPADSDHNVEAIRYAIFGHGFPLNRGSAVGDFDQDGRADDSLYTLIVVASNVDPKTMCDKVDTTRDWDYVKDVHGDIIRSKRGVKRRAIDLFLDDVPDIKLVAGTFLASRQNKTGPLEEGESFKRTINTMPGTIPVTGAVDANGAYRPAVMMGMSFREKALGEPKVLSDEVRDGTATILAPVNERFSGTIELVKTARLEVKNIMECPALSELIVKGGSVPLEDP